MLADSAPARRLASSIPTQHLAFATLIFGTWELYARFVLDNPVLLPPPSQVFAALVTMIVEGNLLPALADSLWLLFIGFTIAFVFAFLFGVIVGRYRVMDLTLSPYFNALYALPTVALTPLVLVWFGFGFGGRLFVVLLAAFFPILINVYTGVKSPPPDLLEVARSFGVKGELAILRQVVLPAAVPFVAAGVRLGIGRAVVGMAIAEVYMRLSGIGALIVQYGAVFKTDFVMASILPLPVLGMSLTKLFQYLEKRVSYRSSQ